MIADDFPPRLRTESTPAVKALLDHAARDAPSNERVTAVVAGVLAATTTPSARALALAKWGKLVVVIGSAALVTIGVTLAIRAQHPSPAPIAAPVATIQTTQVLAPPQDLAPVARTQDDPPIPTQTPILHTHVAGPPHAVTSASSSPDDSSMAVELQRVIAIRQRMLAKDPQGVLEGAEAYERDYPHGMFIPEAEAMEIEGLNDSSRGDEAKTRADRFLAQYGTSPQAARVRALRERMK